MRLAEYDYKFEKIKGSENYIADSLSRDVHTINSIGIHIPDTQEIYTEQLKDGKLMELKNKILNTKVILKSSEDNYFVRNDILMHTGKINRSVGSKELEQIVVPNSLKPYILAMGHTPHFGHLKTYNKIKENYFWEDLYTDSKNYVQSCTHCMGFRSPNRFASVPLQTNIKAERPRGSSVYGFRRPTTQNKK